MKSLILGLTALASTATAATQGVFAHYMVGGITAEHAATDVTDAKNLGLDAFALNLGSLDPYATDPDSGALKLLFDAADQNGFHLFFSFDTAAFQDTDASQFLPLVKQYQDRPSYYKVDNRPFVSTFHGATKTYGQADANSGWQNAFGAAGVTPYFVPNFDDLDGYPNGIVDKFPFADGFFSWESAWPAADQGIANVSLATDQGVVQQTKNAGKTYMMPWSSVQFKNLDGNFYYRIGELNYAQRIEQLLEVEPDFVEIITWNDAPESHYIGNWWDEALNGSPAHSYIDGFDHKGWQQLVPGVIAALKAGSADASSIYPASGKAVAGAMWYRPVLTSTSCASGKPSGAENAQDVVNFAVSLPSGSSDYSIVVSSGGSTIGTFAAQGGLTYNFAGTLAAGQGPRVDVNDGQGNTVASAVGTIDVQSSADVCNYNYAVYGF